MARMGLVFISHMTEEAELAAILKDAIQTDFLGAVEVFVASDRRDLLAGARWMDTIAGKLHEASVEIVLCSSRSVGRPWINFEAGAGWIRNIPIIPVCHTDLSPGDLGPPLSYLQAINAGDREGLERLYIALAEACQMNQPSVDFEALASRIREYEKKQPNRTTGEVTSTVPLVGEPSEDGGPGYLDVLKDGFDAIESINSNLGEWVHEMNSYNTLIEDYGLQIESLNSNPPRRDYVAQVHRISELVAMATSDLARKLAQDQTEQEQNIDRVNAALELLAEKYQEQSVESSPDDQRSFITSLQSMLNATYPFFESIERLKASVSSMSELSRSMRRAAGRLIQSLDWILTNFGRLRLGVESTIAIVGGDSG